MMISFNKETHKGPSFCVVYYIKSCSTYHLSSILLIKIYY